MVDEESLQNYADEVFAGLALEAPKAERNKGNGKFRLTVLADNERHYIELDENTLHAAMKAEVRELRDKLFPPKEEPAVEFAVVDAPLVPEPEPTPAAELPTRPDPEPVAAVEPEPTGKKSKR